MTLPIPNWAADIEQAMGKLQALDPGNFEVNRAEAQRRLSTNAEPDMTAVRAIESVCDDIAAGRGQAVR